MRKFFTLLCAAICCASWMNAQEIANWSGWRTAAASFTFDDGAPSHITDVGPLFDEYGYKATFFLVTNWNPNWEGFQALVDNGHEVGSHSKSHGQNMQGEEKSSKDSINAHITGQDCNTVGYPNCNAPSDFTAVRANYIAARTCNGNEMIMDTNGPADWYKVGAIITGSNDVTYQTTTAEAFVAVLQQAVQKAGWVVFMTHGIVGKNNGMASYSPTPIDALRGALQWAQNNDNDIWVTTFRNVVMYCKERQATSFTQVSGDNSRKTYSLTHNIADNLCQYDYPLSLRVPLPNGWNSAYVSQAGHEINLQMRDDYMYFDAIPNGGDIVLSETAEAIDNITTAITATKCIENGILLIKRNGKTYNAQGAEIK